MENKLEQLLNSLIEKGWKPFGEYDRIMAIWRYNWKRVFDFGVLWEVEYSIRELVSKESWLWQFVCENKLENPKEWKQRTDLDEDGREYVKYSTKFDEYRLIESSLKDESELEDFLLQNIKVGW